MPIYILDSFALLSFFRDEPGADIVEKILHEAANDKHELYMTAINAGEVWYMSYRKDGETKAALAWEAIKQLPLHVVNADAEFCLAAAKIKAKHKLSYADAFAAALTIQKSGVLLTGDSEFNALVGQAGFKVKYIV